MLWTMISNLPRRGSAILLLLAMQRVEHLAAQRIAILRVQKPFGSLACWLEAHVGQKAGAR